MAPICGSRRSRSSSRWRAGASSSTTRTLILSGADFIGFLFNHAQGQNNLHQGAALFLSPDRKAALTIWIHAGDALSGDRKTEPGGILQAPSGRQPGAVIGYADGELSVGRLRRHCDRAARGARRNTVPYGIFD